MFFRKKSESSKAVPTNPISLLVQGLKDYTMGSTEALHLHFHLGRNIADRNIKGDIVECGVYNGGSAAAMCLGANMEDRKIWLYDSFEGMPPTKDIDGKDAATYVGQCVGDIGKVKEAMAIAGVNDHKYVIRKGWFNQTFKEEGPKTIALLHIDSDWYDSVTSCLDRFYDVVEEGGVILLDDFGHWEGCRNAFFDFVAKRNIKPLVERRGHTQLFWVKGKENNRDRSGLKMTHENL